MKLGVMDFVATQQKKKRYK